MDNSPIWDESLNSINITDYKYSKKRIDKHKVNDDERPSDLTYERYMYLVELFKKYNYEFISFSRTWLNKFIPVSSNFFFLFSKN